jgi:acyl carrier protein
MTNRSLNAIAEATTLEQRVQLLLGEIVRDDVSAIEHDQPLSDLDGWDSLAVLDLLSGVEKALGLSVELEALAAVETFGDLLALIEEASREGTQ